VNVYDRIKQERVAQDAQWGGPEHDDSHHAEEWLEWIQKQLDTADELIGSDDRPANAAELFCQRMVKIAALSVACVESIDRSNLAEYEPSAIETKRDDLLLEVQGLKETLASIAETQAEAGTKGSGYDKEDAEQASALLALCRLIGVDGQMIAIGLKAARIRERSRIQAGARDSMLKVYSMLRAGDDSGAEEALAEEIAQLSKWVAPS
jgi:hypothetical protein